MGHGIQILTKRTKLNVCEKSTPRTKMPSRLLETDAYLDERTKSAGVQRGSVTTDAQGYSVFEFPLHCPTTPRHCHVFSRPRPSHHSAINYSNSTKILTSYINLHPPTTVAASKLKANNSDIHVYIHIILNKIKRFTTLKNMFNEIRHNNNYYYYYKLC